MNDQDAIDALLHYWFGELDGHGCCAPGQQQLWFRYSDDTDRDIQSRFGTSVKRALAGELDHWEASGAGLVALLILQDQLTRNVYRGTPAAFSGDSRALALARRAVAAGRDTRLPTIHRVFLYIPYEHAEDLAAQEDGISLFDSLMEQCEPRVRDEVAGYRDYSVAHRDVIERFGRFPHRNEILGRSSTAGELEYLEKYGGF